MLNKITPQTKIGIVGFGTFGSLVGEILADYFEEILVFDSHLDQKRLTKSSLIPASLKEVAACEGVILAVPIGKFEGVVKKIAPLVNSGTLVVDVCSVKVEPARAMQAHFGPEVELLATHPTWGRDSYQINEGLKGLKVVLCPVRIQKKLLDQISQGLKRAGLKVLIQTPQKHDQQAAHSQVLAQFVGKILQKMPLKEVDVTTLGYRHLQGLLPFVVNNSDELFCDLQNRNPYGEKTRKNFLKKVHQVNRMLLKKRLTRGQFARERALIDYLDGQILSLLEERFKVAEKIGKIKKKEGISVFDPRREQAIIENRKKQTKLPEEFLKEFYRIVFEEAKRRQK